jgi:hypothetical protein
MAKIERPGPPRMPQKYFNCLFVCLIFYSHSILFKLFGFTIILFILPVLSFFVSKNLIFQSTLLFTHSIHFY